MTPSPAIAPRVAAFACAAAFALAGCGGEPTSPAIAPTSSGGPVTAYDNHDPSVGYVGAAACRECHAEIAESYARTGMGRAFYPLDAVSEVEDFERANELALPSGLRYRMAKRDGRYFMRQFVLDSAGREIVADEREMRWVIGSGNHSRSYVTEFDGQLFQLPVCWYPRASVWGPCPGFEHDSEHFRRHATRTCVFCHNGRMVGVEGTISAYRDPVPHGIGCERCHGPGEAHVARWREGGIPTGGLDPTIVNPRRLPSPERIEVCFQCHLGDSKATERVAVLDSDLLDWRPGMRLSRVIEPFRFAAATRHDFGLSAQADRLVLSACYRASGGAIECLTCHDPHSPVYDPERSADFFNRRCRGCHDRGECTASSASREATEPEDDCTACHMRRAQPDDQMHTIMTDHWIRRRIDDDARDPRANLSVEPVISGSLAARSEGEQAFYRARADYLLSLKTGDPRRPEMWQRAAREFEAATTQGVDRADAWFFLARVRQYVGRGDAAISALERAVALDPGHHDAALALATALLDRGDVGRARETLERILADRPGHPGALAELARSHLGDDLERALSLFGRAADGEPWNGSLRSNRGMILAALGRFDEAAEETLAGLRLDPEDAQAWDTYARILARIGRADDAREAATVARRMGGGA